MRRVICCSLLVLLLGVVGKAAEVATFKSFVLPPQNGAALYPISITPGPDGAMWFTSVPGNVIGRITSTGQMAFFPLPTSGVGPWCITTGPDRKLWFTEFTGGRIGRLDPSNGAITEFVLPTVGTMPMNIVAGADGALWFTEAAGRIGRITTTGSITEFPIPAGYAWGYDIASDPLGLWLTQRPPLIAAVGRVDWNGTITERPIPPWHTGPGAITKWSAMTWYVDASGSLGRIEPTGSIIAFPIGAVRPQGIAAGLDGHVWVADSGAARIIRVDPIGGTQTFDFPGKLPSAIAVAPDNAVWISDEMAGSSNVLYRMTVEQAGGPRRRAATPPTWKPPAELPPCVPGFVAKAPESANVTDLALIGDRVVVSDDNGLVATIGKNGGTWSTVGQVKGLMTAQLVADDNRIYFLAAEEDASLVDVYSVSKSGGTPAVIANDIVNPSMMVGDGDYLYVVSVGTGADENILPDGAVVRIRKDGSETLKLAQGLSAPYAIAVSDGDVFFSETGIAIGAPNSGIRRVAASGGAVTTLAAGVIALNVAVDAKNVYFDSYDLTTDELTASLQRVPRSGGAPVTLYEGVTPFDLKVIGDRLYYMQASWFGGGTIEWVPVAGGNPSGVSADIMVPRFAYDDCNLYYISSDGSVNRAQR